MKSYEVGLLLCNINFAVIGETETIGHRSCNCMTDCAVINGSSLCACVCVCVFVHRPTCVCVCVSLVRLRVYNLNLYTEIS